MVRNMNNLTINHITNVEEWENMKVGWNRLLRKSKLNDVFLTYEWMKTWWDFFGKEGQYEYKHILFKLFVGKYELWSEVHNKKKADGVIALSNFTLKRAIENGISLLRFLLRHNFLRLQNQTDMDACLDIFLISPH